MKQIEKKVIKEIKAVANVIYGMGEQGLGKQYAVKTLSETLQLWLQDTREEVVKEIRKIASFEPGVSSSGWYTIYAHELDKLTKKK